MECNTFSAFVPVKGSDIHLDATFEGPGPTRTDEVPVPTDPNASFGPEDEYYSLLKFNPFEEDGVIHLMATLAGPETEEEHIPLDRSDPSNPLASFNGFPCSCLAEKPFYPLPPPNSLHDRLDRCIKIALTKLCYWGKAEYCEEHLFLETNITGLTEEEHRLFLCLPHRHTVVKDNPNGIYRSNTQ